MPDDLFSPLGEGQLPPMASASTVRARGDQRRRRSRVAVSGAGALVVALAVTGGLALAGGERQVLLPATPLPSSSAPTPPSSDASPTGAPTPGPSAPPLTSAADLLLTTERADRAAQGSWEVLADAVTDPLLDPCTGGTAYPRSSDRVDQAAGALLARREAGGTDLQQTVARYSSADAAADAFDGYRRAVQACPSHPAEGDELGAVNHALVGSSDDDGVRTLLIGLERTCGETCLTAYSYLAVQQLGDVVSVLQVADGEDGEPGIGLLEPFADAVAEQLRTAT